MFRCRSSICGSTHCLRHVYHVRLGHMERGQIRPDPGCKSHVLLRTFVPISGADVDKAVNAAFTALLLVTLFVVLISVAAEGRNSAKFVFTHYDYSFSG